jgi:tetratricopeptide (TPR) repeat protein
MKKLIEQYQNGQLSPEEVEQFEEALVEALLNKAGKIDYIEEPLDDRQLQEKRKKWEMAVNTYNRNRRLKYIAFVGLALLLLGLIWYSLRFKELSINQPIAFNTEGALKQIPDEYRQDINRRSRAPDRKEAHPALDSLHRLIEQSSLDYNKILQQLDSCEKLGKIDYDEGWWIRALAYYETGQYKEAQSLLDKLIEGGSHRGDGLKLKQQIVDKTK